MPFGPVLFDFFTLAAIRVEFCSIYVDSLRNPLPIHLALPLFGMRVPTLEFRCNLAIRRVV